MVDVAPLRAWGFDPAKADPARVASPPHDCVSEEQLAALRKIPHNIVHATLPAAHQGRKKIDPFLEADRVLTEWSQAGVLRPHSEDSVYAYECAYVHRGTQRRMRGVILRLRLDATYKQVLPHEEIFPKFVEPRLKLLRATGFDLEPIQLLYSGKNADEALWAYLEGSQLPPDLSIAALDGARHRYWRVTDAAIIGTVVDAFKGRKVYIADGHHRYAAAVQYAQERRAREYRPPRDSLWEYKLSLLVNAADAGLTILPTHRVVKRSKIKDPKALEKRWAAHFRVELVTLPEGNPVTALERALEAAPHRPVVGAWLGEPGRGYLLAAKEPVVSEELHPGRSRTWRSLDVVHLQQFALGEGMGVPPAKWGEDVYYTRDDEEAAQWVRKKRAVAVLTHQPTQLAQMRAIADGGERMPPKSTYFLPKTLSGPVLYRIGKPEGPPSKPRITS